MSLPKIESTRASAMRPPLSERGMVVVTGACRLVRGGVIESKESELGDRRGRSQRVFQIGDIRVRQLGIYRMRQIPLTEVADDRYDQLAGIFAPAGDLEGGPGDRAARDTREDSLLPRQTPRRGDRVVVGHLHHLVIDLGIEQTGHETGADALLLV